MYSSEEEVEDSGLSVIWAFLATGAAMVLCIITSGRADMITNLESQINRVKIENSALVAKYEGTMCHTRGLTLTTVKGITLCMDPETKALHKIDNTAD